MNHRHFARRPDRHDGRRYPPATPCSSTSAPPGAAPARPCARRSRSSCPARATRSNRSTSTARPSSSDRYRVEAVPTFVVVDARGKALARTSGRDAREPTRLPSTTRPSSRFARDLPTPPPRRSDSRPRRGSVRDSRRPKGSVDRPAPTGQPEAPGKRSSGSRCTSRMIASGVSAPGTIIYSSAEESIILTCAHIFRIEGQPKSADPPKNFRVPISVDLFDGQLVQPTTRAGRHAPSRTSPARRSTMISTNDVGLIRIKPGRKLASSRVVPAYWKPQRRG